MDMKNYEKQDGMGYDALREIGSIGTGNAATALSAVLGRKIEMTLPEVKLVGFDKAIEELGGPEKIVVGVLTEISGEVNGIIDVQLGYFRNDRGWQYYHIILCQRHVRFDRNQNAAFCALNFHEHAGRHHECTDDDVRLYNG